jgi:hypothetical protein
MARDKAFSHQPMLNLVFFKKPNGHMRQTTTTTMYDDNGNTNGNEHSIHRLSSDKTMRTLREQQEPQRKGLGLCTHPDPFKL